MPQTKKQANNRERASEFGLESFFQRGNPETEETEKRIKHDAEDRKEGKENEVKAEMNDAIEQKQYREVTDYAVEASYNRLDILRERRVELERETESAKGFEKKNKQDELKRLVDAIVKTEELIGRDEADREKHIEELVYQEIFNIDEDWDHDEEDLAELMECTREDFVTIDREKYSIPRLLQDRIEEKWYKWSTKLDDFEIWKRVKSFYELMGNVTARVKDAYLKVGERAAGLYDRLDKDFSGRDLPSYLKSAYRYEATRRLEEHVWERYLGFWNQMKYMWRSLNVNWWQKIEELRGIWPDKQVDEMHGLIEDDFANDKKLKEMHPDMPVAEQKELGQVDASEGTEPVEIITEPVETGSIGEKKEEDETGALAVSKQSATSESSEAVLVAEEVLAKQEDNVAVSEVASEPALAEEQDAEQVVENVDLPDALKVLEQIDQLHALVEEQAEPNHDEMEYRFKAVEKQIDKDYGYFEQELMERLGCEDFDKIAYKVYLAGAVELGGLLEDEVDARLVEWTTSLDEKETWKRVGAFLTILKDGDEYYRQLQEGLIDENVALDESGPAKELASYVAERRNSMFAKFARAWSEGTREIDWEEQLAGIEERKGEKFLDADMGEVVGLAEEVEILEEDISGEGQLTKFATAPIDDIEKQPKEALEDLQTIDEVLGAPLAEVGIESEEVLVPASDTAVEEETKPLEQIEEVDMPPEVINKDLQIPSEETEPFDTPAAEEFESVTAEATEIEAQEAAGEAPEEDTSEEMMSEEKIEQEETVNDDEAQIDILEAESEIQALADTDETQDEQEEESVEDAKESKQEIVDRLVMEETWGEIASQPEENLAIQMDEGSEAPEARELEVERESDSIVEEEIEDREKETVVSQKSKEEEEQEEAKAKEEIEIALAEEPTEILDNEKEVIEPIITEQESEQVGESSEEVLSAEKELEQVDESLDEPDTIEESTVEVGKQEPEEITESKEESQENEAASADEARVEEVEDMLQKTPVKIPVKENAEQMQQTEESEKQSVADEELEEVDASLKGLEEENQQTIDEEIIEAEEAISEQAQPLVETEEEIAEEVLFPLEQEQEEEGEKEAEESEALLQEDIFAQQDLKPLYRHKVETPTEEEVEEELVVEQTQAREMMETDEEKGLSTEQVLDQEEEKELSIKESEEEIVSLENEVLETDSLEPAPEIKEKDKDIGESIELDEEREKIEEIATVLEEEKPVAETEREESESAEEEESEGEVMLEQPESEVHEEIYEEERFDTISELEVEEVDQPETVAARIGEEDADQEVEDRKALEGIEIEKELKTNTEKLVADEIEIKPREEEIEETEEVPDMEKEVQPSTEQFVVEAQETQAEEFLEQEGEQAVETDTEVETEQPDADEVVEDFLETIDELTEEIETQNFDQVELAEGLQSEEDTEELLDTEIMIDDNGDRWQAESLDQLAEQELKETEQLERKLKEQILLAELARALELEQIEPPEERIGQKREEKYLLRPVEEKEQEADEKKEEKQVAAPENLPTETIAQLNVVNSLFQMNNMRPQVFFTNSDGQAEMAYRVKIRALPKKEEVLERMKEDGDLQNIIDGCPYPCGPECPDFPCERIVQYVDRNFVRDQILGWRDAEGAYRSSQLEFMRPYEKLLRRIEIILAKETSRERLRNFLRHLLKQLGYRDVESKLTELMMNLAKLRSFLSDKHDEIQKLYGDLEQVLNW